MLKRRGNTYHTKPAGRRIDHGFQIQKIEFASFRLVPLQRRSCNDNAEKEAAEKKVFHILLLMFKEDRKASLYVWRIKLPKQMQRPF